jgi:hypothetical protein
MTRERNARLVELFVTARDAALDVGVTTGQLKPRGSWRLPSYISAEVRTAPIRSPGVRDITLAQLGVQFPGMVRGLVH